MPKKQNCCESPDIINEDWYKVCTECGLMFEPPFFSKPKDTTRQPRVRSISSKYSRVSNFELHLKQLKGDLKIKEEDYEKLIEIKKAFHNRDVSYKNIKIYLKANQLNKLYPLIPTLMLNFWGIPTLTITRQEEEKMVLRFLSFERAFELVDKGDRKNSISYEFLIKQFLEEINNTSSLNIPSLIDKKKLAEVKHLYNQVVLIEKL